MMLLRLRQNLAYYRKNRDAGFNYSLRDIFRNNIKEINSKSSRLTVTDSLISLIDQYVANPNFPKATLLLDELLTIAEQIPDKNSPLRKLVFNYFHPIYAEISLMLGRDAVEKLGAYPARFHRLQLETVLSQRENQLQRLMVIPSRNWFKRLKDLLMPKPFAFEIRKIQRLREAIEKTDDHGLLVKMDTVRMVKTIGDIEKLLHRPTFEPTPQEKHDTKINYFKNKFIERFNAQILAHIVGSAGQFIYKVPSPATVAKKLAEKLAYQYAHQISMLFYSPHAFDSFNKLVHVIIKNALNNLRKTTVETSIDSHLLDTLKKLTPEDPHYQEIILEILVERCLQAVRLNFNHIPFSEFLGPKHLMHEEDQVIIDGQKLNLFNLLAKHGYIVLGQHGDLTFYSAHGLRPEKYRYIFSNETEVKRLYLREQKATDDTKSYYQALHLQNVPEEKTNRLNKDIITQCLDVLENRLKELENKTVTQSDDIKIIKKLLVPFEKINVATLKKETAERIIQLFKELHALERFLAISIEKMPLRQAEIAQTNKLSAVAAG